MSKVKVPSVSAVSQWQCSGQLKKIRRCDRGEIMILFHLCLLVSSCFNQHKSNCLYLRPLPSISLLFIHLHSKHLCFCPFKTPCVHLCLICQLDNTCNTETEGWSVWNEYRCRKISNTRSCTMPIALWISQNISPWCECFFCRQKQELWYKMWSWVGSPRKWESQENSIWDLGRITLLIFTLPRSSKANHLSRKLCHSHRAEESALAQ